MHASTREETIEALVESDEHREFMPRYHGSQPFTYFVEQDMIAPHYTTIRAMYTGVVDKVFQVNHHGRLTPLTPGAKPKDALPYLSSLEHGWEIEQFKPPGVRRPE